MSEIGNVKITKIEDLNKDGRYNKTLLDSLNSGKFEELQNLQKSDRASLDFMEPLLYAVKNEFGTYIVYSYYSESLQEDLNLATEIIQTEPELIEGTPISRNKEFILENVNSVPQILEHIDPILLEDEALIKQICERGNGETIKEISKSVDLSKVIIENPEMRDNKEVLAQGIAQDGRLIALASESLKNDYEFLKEAFQTNMEAIDYTAEHTDEFGEKGLLAAKEVIIDNSSSNAIKGFEEQRDQTAKKIAEHRQGDNTEQPEEIKQLELDEKRFERHIKFIQKIKDGKIDPVRAAQLMNSICENLEPEYRKRLEQMLTIDTAMKQKQQEGEITKAGIKEAALNFEELGEHPTSELPGIKEAIANLKENETPEISSDEPEK